MITPGIQKQSRNQLYKQAKIKYGCTKSYKDWLESEMAIFETKGKEATGMADFDAWLNEKYKRRAEAIAAKDNDNKANAIGDELKAGAKDLWSQTKDSGLAAIQKEIEGRLEDKTDTAKEKELLDMPVEKTVFGMKPIVAYSLVGLVILAIGTGIFFMIRANNKQLNYN